MKKTWHDPNHPIWRIGTILALAILVVAVEFGNAKKIDFDEVSKSGQLIGGVGIGAWLKHLLTNGGKA